MSVHTASLKGKRQQNEDKHVSFLNINGDDTTRAKINLFGVFDGHGGKFVSKFLHDNLAQIMTDKRVEYPLDKSFIVKIYNGLQNILRNKYKKYASECGSTCLVISHFKTQESSYLNVLNTGDTRAVLCRNNMAHLLTKDHKPHWPEEEKRIKKLGGEIILDQYGDWRIGDLSVSRAFGDLNAEPYVTCLPDIYKYKLSKNDKFMILACDGLWDVLDNQDAINFVLKYGFDESNKVKKDVNIAVKLAEYALKAGSTDNITIHIVFF